MSSKNQRLFSPRTPEVFSYRSVEALRPYHGPGRLEKFGSAALIVTSLISLQHNVPKITEQIVTIVEEENQAVAYAERTLDLYDDADVAIVAFEMHQDLAEDIAEDIEDTFNEMSDGIVSIDVAVIEPSLEARQLYGETNPDSCVDKNDVTSYGSFLAEAAMPELKQYDKILALNADPACQENIGGVASSLNDRYSEVFRATDGWSAIQMNNGEQAVVTNGENGSQFTSYINSPVSTGVHELYHLFGLGHMGVLTTKAEQRDDIQILKTYTDGPKLIDFDIRKAIAQKDYSEYGNPGIMGQGIMEYSPELSTIEKFVVEWPLRRLDKETQITAHSLNETSVTFDAKTTKDAVAVYEFESGIEMKGHEYTYNFNRIVFVPNVGEKAYENAFTSSVTVYLMDGGNNFAELGTMVNVNQQTTTFTLTLDEELLTAVIDYDAAQVTIEKAAK